MSELSDPRLLFKLAASQRGLSHPQTQERKRLLKHLFVADWLGDNWQPETWPAVGTCPDPSFKLGPVKFRLIRFPGIVQNAQSKTAHTRLLKHRGNSVAML